MQAVVLASGKSSRMWPLATGKNKCFYEFLGKPLIGHCAEAAFEAGVRELIITVSPRDERLAKKIFEKNKRVKLAVQKEPRGMGDSLLCASSYLNSDFLVLNAEMVFEKVLKRVSKAKTPGALAIRETETPWLYGIVGTKGKTVIKVVEKPQRGKEPSNKRIVGAYKFPGEFLRILGRTKEEEYNFETALQEFVSKFDCEGVDTSDLECKSVKYPWHYLDLADYLMREKLPKKTIAKSAQVAESAIVEGNAFVGNNAVIRENAVVKGPCYIGDDCVVGTNSLIRQSHLGKGVEAGFGSEIARSILFEGVHCHHAFVGDSVIGQNSRLGFGTVLANKRFDRQSVWSSVKGEKIDTRRDSLGAILGENAAIGVNASVMPGVKIGSNSRVFPNAVVTGDLQGDSEFK
jgi:bifunctional UDP-N-acetylglucosamine pyrophosphorylase/glucosamine-1-phosphate N-acetyltransferase